MEQEKAFRLQDMYLIYGNILTFSTHTIKDENGFSV